MDSSVFDELSQYVEWEGLCRWIPIPVNPKDLENLVLPRQWTKALMGPATIEERVKTLWGGLKDRLPRAYVAFATKTRGLALLHTRDQGISLVYIFNADGELAARRGFLPVRELPHLAARFPVDLMPLYELHDGIINLMSYDGGPLPCSEWRTLVDPESKQPTLIKIAMDGSDAFGFDVSESPFLAYALWPDENEVEQIDDVWSFIDDLLANRIEQF